MPGVRQHDETGHVRGCIVSVHASGVCAHPSLLFGSYSLAPRGLHRLDCVRADPSCTLADVAKARGLKETTVAGHMADLVHNGCGSTCFAWCGVMWCGMVWCGVVWCGVVWCGVVWCGVVWCGVVWCGVVGGGVVWCGVVWCGVVWCGVVWCGVVWCGVVWCGVVEGGVMCNIVQRVYRALTLSLPFTVLWVSDTSQV